ncbi:hypothetical protein [Rubritalea sp.]|uniref:hypothetical protein n=1 Tax=Rubritalea sp. TaxID=2109375 RepID=UPI003EF66C8E
MRHLKLLLIALALVLLWLIIKSPSNELAEEAEAEQLTQRKRSHLQTTHRSTSSLTSAGQHKVLYTPANGIPLEHKAEHLVDFHLQEIEFIDDSLEQAVAKLLYNYETICLRTGEKPIAFNLHIEGEPIGNITFKWGGSFKGLLQDLALMAGMDLHLDEDIITFTEPEDTSDQPKTTQSFAVPPDFPWLLPSSHLSHEKMTPNQAMQLLAKQLRFGPESKLWFSRPRSALTVRSDQTKLNKVADLVDRVRSIIPIQSKIKTTLYSVPKTAFDTETTPHQSSFTEEEFHTYLDTAPDYLESDLHTLVVRYNEGTQLELIRETGAESEDWGGLRINYNPSKIGFRNHLKVEYEQRPLDNPGFIKISIDQEVKVSKESFIKNNEPTFLKTHESEGYTYYIGVFASEIDATGAAMPVSDPSDRPPSEEEIIWENK